LIFVRQGYDAQAICGGGPVYGNPNAPATKWHTFNMHTGDIMADDPRDEGSMFKFGNAWNCISSENNIYKDDNGNPIYYEQSENGFKPQQTLVYLQAAGNVHPTCNTWGASGGRVAGFTEQAVGDMKINKAATMRDFEQLYLTKYVEFGYGVLYADGATETQSTLEMVNGWSHYDDSPDKDKKGMRGVFAYYWNPNGDAGLNARNIFFPIGRSGYGHRKHGNESTENNKKGILRYSCNRYMRAHSTTPQFEFRRRAPLMEFIYRRMGAIYWARTKTGEGQYLTWNGQPPSDKEAQRCGMGLDLNYFTFDVNAISDNNVSNGEDACFVRTVEYSAGD
ncbi:MAG: hypothetical protein K2G77_01195, partial [Muribaculaceae bacterium]|nr:hypothetical protein [Muribaculaceae bacterium]